MSNKRESVIHLLLGATIALVAAATHDAAIGQTLRAFEVVRAEDSEVDLALDHDRELSPGDRLVVERSGKPITEVRVLSVASRVAHCRIVTRIAAIAPGDLAYVQGDLASVQEPATTAQVVDSQPGSRSQAPSSSAAETPGSLPTPNLDTASASVPNVPSILVSQVAGDKVFLDAGRRANLSVGQQIRLWRGDRPVALVEIAYISSSSSSCIVISASESILEGDRAVPLPRELDVPATGEKKAVVTPKDRPRSKTRKPAGLSGTDLRGSISARFQRFEDEGEAPRVLDQTTLRVSMALRNIAGSDYEFRMRARGREDSDARFGSETENDRSDRLYEMELIYDPDDSKYSYRLGRIPSGPLIGFDYLDGVQGEFHINSRMGVGGFYGTRSDIESFGLDGTLTSYGAFFHYENRQRGRPFYSDFMIGAIGEYDGADVNREFISVYGRQGGGSRWSLYERADLDFNTSWRTEASEGSYQVSNLLLSGSYKIIDSVRVSLTYDQRRRYRTLENRDTPEDRFDDMLREGARLTLYVGAPAGLRFTGSVGLRRREGSSENNTTLNGSLYHSNIMGWRLLLATDYSSFSGDSSSGSRIGLRVRKYFERGHDVGLTVGTSVTELLLNDTRAKDDWIRASGTLQLPKRTFALLEYEWNTGDTFEGSRSFIQLGYRF
ncbi:MAG: hypothetical protein K8J08_04755 [Thermoanaerobaculia bacterium]|nr:hypothetical protein [Thermoanaerobaculia bacterium]